MRNIAWGIKEAEGAYRSKHDVAIPIGDPVFVTNASGEVFTGYHAVERNFDIRNFKYYNLYKEVEDWVENSANKGDVISCDTWFRLFFKEKKITEQYEDEDKEQFYKYYNFVMESLKEN